MARTHYIAMEFVDSVTLREKIHRERTKLRKLLRYLQYEAEGPAKAPHTSGQHESSRWNILLISGPTPREIVNRLHQQLGSGGTEEGLWYFRWKP